MTEPVLLEQRGHIAIITLNRPEMRNALSSQEMIDGIVAAFDTIQRDKSVHVAILTGAGSAFSSGGDIKRLQANAELAQQSPWALVDQYRNGIQRIPRAIAAIDVPVIAAVNGPAIGAGCDLACMCDLRIAGASARFAESFVNLGIVAGDGGAWLLPRVVGKPKALEMALTGDSVSAEEAVACGLVSRVVADDVLMQECLNLAERIAKNPTFAVRMTKLLIKESDHAQLGTVLHLSAAMQALAHSTSEHREAVAGLGKNRKS
jgi:enoyl-CoA hydratase/carnithine racemase